MVKFRSFLKKIFVLTKKMQKSKTTFWPIGFTFYTMPKKKENQLLAFNTWRLEKHTSNHIWMYNIF